MTTLKGATKTFSNQKVKEALLPQSLVNIPLTQQQTSARYSTQRYTKSKSHLFSMTASNILHSTTTQPSSAELLISKSDIESSASKAYLFWRHSLNIETQNDISSELRISPMTKAYFKVVKATVQSNYTVEAELLSKGKLERAPTIHLPKKQRLTEIRSSTSTQYDSTTAMETITQNDFWLSTMTKLKRYVKNKFQSSSNEQLNVLITLITQSSPNVIVQSLSKQLPDEPSGPATTKPPVTERVSSQIVRQVIGSLVTVIQTSKFGLYSKNFITTDIEQKVSANPKLSNLPVISVALVAPTDSGSSAVMSGQESYIANDSATTNYGNNYNNSESVKVVKFIETKASPTTVSIFLRRTDYSVSFTRRSGLITVQDNIKPTFSVSSITGPAYTTMNQIKFYKPKLVLKAHRFSETQQNLLPSIADQFQRYTCSLLNTLQIGISHSTIFMPIKSSISRLDSLYIPVSTYLLQERLQTRQTLQVYGYASATPTASPSDSQSMPMSDSHIPISKLTVSSSLRAKLINSDLKQQHTVTTRAVLKSLVIQPLTKPYSPGLTSKYIRPYHTVMTFSTLPIPLLLKVGLSSKYFVAITERATESSKIPYSITTKEASKKQLVKQSLISRTFSPPSMATSFGIKGNPSMPLKPLDSSVTTLSAQKSELLRKRLTVAKDMSKDFNKQYLNTGVSILWSEFSVSAVQIDSSGMLNSPAQYRTSPVASVLSSSDIKPFGESSHITTDSSELSFPAISFSDLLTSFLASICNSRCSYLLVTTLTAFPNVSSNTLVSSTVIVLSTDLSSKTKHFHSHATAQLFRTRNVYISSKEGFLSKSSISTVHKLHLLSRQDSYFSTESHPMIPHDFYSKTKPCQAYTTAQLSRTRDVSYSSKKHLEGKSSIVTAHELHVRPTHGRLKTYFSTETQTITSRETQGSLLSTLPFAFQSIELKHSYNPISQFHDSAAFTNLGDAEKSRAQLSSRVLRISNSSSHAFYGTWISSSSCHAVKFSKSTVAVATHTVRSDQSSAISLLMAVPDASIHWEVHLSLAVTTLQKTLSLAPSELFTKESTKTNSFFNAIRTRKSSVYGIHFIATTDLKVRYSQMTARTGSSSTVNTGTKTSTKINISLSTVNTAVTNYQNADIPGDLSASIKKPETKSLNKMQSHISEMASVNQFPPSTCCSQDTVIPESSDSQSFRTITLTKPELQRSSMFVTSRTTTNTFLNEIYSPFIIDLKTMVHPAEEPIVSSRYAPSIASTFRNYIKKSPVKIQSDEESSSGNTSVFNHHTLPISENNQSFLITNTANSAISDKSQPVIDLNTMLHTPVVSSQYAPYIKKSHVMIQSDKDSSSGNTSVFNHHTLPIAESSQFVLITNTVSSVISKISRPIIDLKTMLHTPLETKVSSQCTPNIAPTIPRNNRTPYIRKSLVLIKSDKESSKENSSVFNQHTNIHIPENSQSFLITNTGSSFNSKISMPLIVMKTMLHTPIGAKVNSLYAKSIAPTISRTNEAPYIKSSWTKRLQVGTLHFTANIGSPFISEISEPIIDINTMLHTPVESIFCSPYSPSIARKSFSNKENLNMQNSYVTIQSDLKGSSTKASILNKNASRILEGSQFHFLTNGGRSAVSEISEPIIDLKNWLHPSKAGILSGQNDSIIAPTSLTNEEILYMQESYVTIQSDLKGSSTKASILNRNASRILEDRKSYLKTNTRTSAVSEVLVPTISHKTRLHETIETIFSIPNSPSIAPTSVTSQGTSCVHESHVSIQLDKESSCANTSFSNRNTLPIADGSRSFPITNTGSTEISEPIVYPKTIPLVSIINSQNLPRIALTSFISKEIRHIKKFHVSITSGINGSNMKASALNKNTLLTSDGSHLYLTTSSETPATYEISEPILNFKIRLHASPVPIFSSGYNSRFALSSTTNGEIPFILKSLVTIRSDIEGSLIKASTLNKNILLMAEGSHSALLYNTGSSAISNIVEPTISLKARPYTPIVSICSGQYGPSIAPKSSTKKEIQYILKSHAASTVNKYILLTGKGILSYLVTTSGSSVVSEISVPKVNFMTKVDTSTVPKFSSRYVPSVKLRSATDTNFTQSIQINTQFYTEKSSEKASLSIESRFFGSVKNDSDSNLLVPVRRTEAFELSVTHTYVQTYVSNTHTRTNFTAIYTTCTTFFLDEPASGLFNSRSTTQSFMVGSTLKAQVTNNIISYVTESSKSYSKMADVSESLIFTTDGQTYKSMIPTTTEFSNQNIPTPNITSISKEQTYIIQRSPNITISYTASASMGTTDLITIKHSLLTPNSGSPSPPIASKERMVSRLPTAVFSLQTYISNITKTTDRQTDGQTYRSMIPTTTEFSNQNIPSPNITSISKEQTYIIQRSPNITISYTASASMGTTDLITIKHSLLTTNSGSPSPPVASKERMMSRLLTAVFSLQTSIDKSLLITAARHLYPSVTLEKSDQHTYTVYSRTTTEYSNWQSSTELSASQFSFIHKPTVINHTSFRSSGTHPITESKQTYLSAFLTALEVSKLSETWTYLQTYTFNTLSMPGLNGESTAGLKFPSSQNTKTVQITGSIQQMVMQMERKESSLITSKISLSVKADVIRDTFGIMFSLLSAQESHVAIKKENTQSFLSVSSLKSLEFASSATSNLHNRTLYSQTMTRAEHFSRFTAPSSGSAWAPDVKNNLIGSQSIIPLSQTSNLEPETYKKTTVTKDDRQYTPTFMLESSQITHVSYTNNSFITPRLLIQGKNMKNSASLQTQSSQGNGSVYTQVLFIDSSIIITKRFSKISSALPMNKSIQSYLSVNDPRSKPLVTKTALINLQTEIVNTPIVTEFVKENISSLTSLFSRNTDTFYIHSNITVTKSHKGSTPGRGTSLSTEENTHQVFISLFSSSPTTSRFHTLSSSSPFTARSQRRNVVRKQSIMELGMPLQKSNYHAKSKAGFFTLKQGKVKRLDGVIAQVVVDSLTECSLRCQRDPKCDGITVGNSVGMNTAGRLLCLLHTGKDAMDLETSHQHYYYEKHTLS